MRAERCVRDGGSGCRAGSRVRARGDERGRLRSLREQSAHRALPSLVASVPAAVPAPSRLRICIAEGAVDASEHFGAVHGTGGRRMWARVEADAQGGATHNTLLVARVAVEALPQVGVIAGRHHKGLVDAVALAEAEGGVADRAEGAPLAVAS